MKDFLKAFLDPMKDFLEDFLEAPCAAVVGINSVEDVSAGSAVTRVASAASTPMSPIALYCAAVVFIVAPRLSKDVCSANDATLLAFRIVPMSPST